MMTCSIKGACDTKGSRQKQAAKKRRYAGLASKVCATLTRDVTIHRVTVTESFSS